MKHRSSTYHARAARHPGLAALGGMTAALAGLLMLTLAWSTPSTASAASIGPISHEQLSPTSRPLTVQTTPTAITPGARPPTAASLPGVSAGGEADTPTTSRQAPLLSISIGFVWNAGEFRGGPGMEYPSIGQVVVGDIVELLDKYQEWWWVRTGSGDGWMEASRLIIDGEASTPISVESVGGMGSLAAVPPGLVTLSGVVRAGPSSDYPAIVSVEAGTTIEILGKNGDWWQVWIKPNVGWINSALLMAATDPAAAPPRAAAAAPAKPTPSVAKSQPAAPPAPAKQVPASPAKPAPAAPVAPAAAAPVESLWNVNVVPGTLARLPAVTAPNPQLAADVVKPFLRARTRVLQSSGVDYLGHLDEALRAVNFESAKPGVANKSWHKAGRAIDLAISYRVGNFEGVVFVRDAANPRYYRVLIRTARQDGSLGKWYGPKQLPRGRQPAFYVDVTTIMLSEGFQRIPPVDDVSEAWHYELRGNHTWASAMQQLYGFRTLQRIYPDVWR